MEAANVPTVSRLTCLIPILTWLAVGAPVAAAAERLDEDVLNKLVDEFDTLGLDADAGAEDEPLEGELELPGGEDEGDGEPKRGGWLSLPAPETTSRQMAIVELMVVIPSRERNRWLLKLLGSESNVAPHVADRIVRELSVSADEENLSTLGELLESRHAPVGYSAARVIGHVGGPKAVALLRGALKDPLPLIRLGAIEGLGYTECEAAEPLIEQALKAASSAGREMALYARRELCWRSGKPMPEPPPAARYCCIGTPAGYTPRKTPTPTTFSQLRLAHAKKDDAQKAAAERIVLVIGTCTPDVDRELRDKPNRQFLRSLLARGGMLWIATDTVHPGLRALLGSLGVRVPVAQAAGMGPPELYVSPGDPWDALMWPRNLMHQTTLKIQAEGFWAKWDEARQSAPLRSPTNPSHAALVLQSGILGHGTIVFSRLKRVMPNPTGVDPQWYFLDAMAALLSPYGLDIPSNLETNAEFVSPHVPWAKPLPGKKMRVLFAPQASCAREAIEIAQRVDCEYLVVPYQERSNPFHPKYRDSGVLDPQAVIWLQTGLGKPWDVLVTGSRWVGVGIMCYGNAWQQWPEGLRCFVRKKVFREGRGLVVFYDHRASNRDRSFADLRPHFVEGASVVSWSVPHFGEQEAPLAEKWVNVAKVGRGQAVLASRCMPILEGWSVENPLGPSAFVDPYEYWYALLARATQVGAGRDGPVRVQEFDLGELQDGKVVVRLRNTSQAAVTARAILRLRNKLDRIEAQREVPLTLPAAAAGNCVFDFGSIAKACIGEFVAQDEQGRVLGWGNCAISGRSRLQIAELSADRDLYPLSAIIALSGKLSQKMPEAGEVRVSLTDVYDRVVSQGRAPIAGGAGAFICRLPTGPTLSRLVHADVVVLSGGHPAASIVRGLLVDVYSRTDFPCYFTGPLASRDQARQLGLDGGGISPQEALRLGLEFYGSGFDGGMHGMYGVSGHDPPGLLDGETLNAWSSPRYHLTQWQKAKESGPTKRLAGLRLTMLADEDCGWYNGWHRMGYAPSTLHELHQSLRRQYGTLDALNRGWETDFKRWREVRPMHFSELGERKSVAAWVDHRVFMEWQFAWRRTFRDVMLLKQYVPDAKVGFSTAGDDCGWDVYAMAKAQTAMLFQLGIQQRKYCSWTKPGDFVATWFGGYQVPPAGKPSNEKACRYFPWRALFSGMTGFLVYADLPGGRHGYLLPDLSPTWPARWIGEELCELKAGPAKLLFSATRDLGAIANYYSNPSQFTHMASAPFVKEAKWGYGAEHRFLDLGWQELGWPQRWVAPEEVRQGRLQQGDLKLLVMGAIAALSQEEAEQVRRFVKGGGTLVGTVEVGSRDEHGGAPLKGQLADVFGFEYLPDQPCATTLGKRRVSFLWNGKSYDLGEAPTPRRPLKATTAKELSTTAKPGDAPHVLLNEFGKGRAFFFNLSPRSLRTFGTWDDKRSLEFDQMLFFLRDLAAQVGADPDVQVRRPDGDTLWRADVAPFRSGRASYYGVMDGVTLFRAGGWTKLDRDAPYKTQEVEIHWDRPGHIYELRSKRYFGKTNRIQIPLRQATALLFAHLPYEITGLSAKPGGSADRGKPLPIQLSIAVSQAPAEDHACLVEVVDASGKARPEYRETVLCAKGEGRYLLPIAYNDPLGAWSVRITEVASGKTAEVSVGVR